MGNVTNGSIAYRFLLRHSDIIGEDCLCSLVLIARGLNVSRSPFWLQTHALWMVVRSGWWSFNGEFEHLMGTWSVCGISVTLGVFSQHVHPSFCKTSWALLTLDLMGGWGCTNTIATITIISVNLYSLPATSSNHSAISPNRWHKNL